jgi:hypothetical protein
MLAYLLMNLFNSFLLQKFYTEIVLGFLNPWNSVILGIMKYPLG